MERIKHVARTIIDEAAQNKKPILELASTAVQLHDMRKQGVISDSDYQNALEYRRHMIALAQGSWRARLRQKFFPFN